MWYYETKIGIFKIFLEPSGRYDLYIDKKKLGTYCSSEAAADAVYSQNTGWEEWDTGPEPDTPILLTEWTEKQNQ
jgi:hypothetical protein